MTTATLPPCPPAVEQSLPSCPYVGLVPFSEHDAAFFFGRENETELIAANVVAARLTLLYAPSGVGKTSVLRAGVIPRLHEIGRGDEDVGMRSTAVAYVSDWSGPPLEVITNEIRRALQETGVQVAAPSPWAGLVQWLRGTLSETGVPAVYIILDQFEEYFLYHPADDDLPTAIGDVLTARGLNVHLLLSLREDALAGLDRFEGHVPHLFENYLRLSYLSRNSARTAIEGPLDRYNSLTNPDARMSIEPELVEAALDEVRAGNVVMVPESATAEAPSPGDRNDIEAPYLQLVLTRLWDEERAQGSSTLRRDTLGRLGGAQTIVQSHLDTVMAELAPEQRDVAAGVFHHLVTTSGSKIALTAEDLADWAEFPVDRVRNLLERLSSGPRRILRPVPPAAGVTSPPRYEVFHDVMGAAVLDWRRRYVSAQQRSEAELKLQQARAAARTARRRLRRARLVAAVMALLLVAACLLGVIAYSSSQNAESALRLAWARQLAAESERLVDTRPDTAILLGLQILSLDRDQQSTPETGLVTGLSRVTHVSRQILGHDQPVLAAAFSPNGALLATGSADATVQLWDTATGAPHGQPLTGHGAWVKTVAFSPDGALLASAGDDDTVRLWDVATGAPHGDPLSGHGSSVWGVEFSPDGALLASAGDDHAVRLWDVATGAPHGQPLTGTSELWSAAFSPRGDVLATGSEDGMVRLWDVATGAPRGEPLVGDGSPVWGVDFSPDGTVLGAFGDEGMVRLWDVATGTPRGEPLTGHDGAVWYMAFSPDGTVLATVGDEGMVRLWDVATGTPRGEPLTGHDGAVWYVAFSPDGALLATAGTDLTVRLWDVASGQPHGQPLTGHTHSIWSLEFSPDGTLLATVSDDSTARLWEVAETSSISQALAHATDVNQVAFSPDGALVATGGSDSTVRLWDVATGRPHGSPLTGHEDWLRGVAFSPDGALLASSSGDGTVRLWDANGAPHGRPLTGHEGAVRNVAFSPDGTLLASAGDDETVRLWDVATGAPHGQPLTGHGGAVWDVVFSPDGALVATVGDDRAVVLWNVATGQVQGEPPTDHAGSVRAVAFSPDGALLATASDDSTVRLWDVSTGRPHRQPLIGHTGAVTGVAFSPDGTLLASAGDDETVRLWDVATGAPHGQPLTGHTGAVWDVVFSPDGARLATAGEDGLVRLWDPDFSRWLQSGCELVNRNLSQTEWTQFVPGLPYERTCPDLPSGEGAPADAPAAEYPD